MRKFAAVLLLAAGTLTASGCFWTIQLKTYSEIARTDDAASLKSDYARVDALSNWGWLLKVRGRGSQAQYLDALWTRLAEVEARASRRAAASAAAPNAGIVWIGIPGGVFTMGARGEKDAQPRRKVEIAPFELSRSLVTVEEYRACVDAGACAEPPKGGQCNWGVAGRERTPINCVSWTEADRFARWARARLPSEAEWEYVARGGGQSRTYPWGDAEPTCDKVVGKGTCAQGGPVPVCARPAGDTPQGVCDMGGYVDEWVQDWYHSSYRGAPSDGSPWESPEGSERVVRGSGMRVDRRSSYFPNSGQFSIGFRLAR
jgi:formylglycine-generating enzyme required for sulfatase activity